MTDTPSWLAEYPEAAEKDWLSEYPEAAPAAKDEPLFDLSDTLSAAGQAVKGLPTTAPHAFRQLYEGLENPWKRGEGYLKSQEAVDAYRQDLEAANLEAEKSGDISTLSRGMRQAGQSLGFSVGAMGAGLVTSTPSAAAGRAIGGLAGPKGAVAGEIIGRGAGALAAGYGAAYRMAGAQFLDDARKEIDAKFLSVTGRLPNEQEQEEAYQELLPLAQAFGNAEAVPEAIGNLAMAGAGKYVFGLGRKTIEKLAASALGKTGAAAGALATELGGETVTGVEQNRIEAQKQAMYRGEQPEETPRTMDEYVASFKEVAPATLATMGLMSVPPATVKAVQSLRGKPAEEQPAPDTDFARRAAMEGATEFRDTIAGVPVVVEGITIATIPPGSDLSPDDVAAFAGMPDGPAIIKQYADQGRIVLPEIVKPVENVDPALTEEMNDTIAAGAATAPATVTTLEEMQALYEAQTLARERQAAEETLRQQEAERAAAEEQEAQRLAEEEQTAAREAEERRKRYEAMRAEQSVKLELTPGESGATGAGMKEEIQQTPVSREIAEAQSAALTPSDADTQQALQAEAAARLSQDPGAEKALRVADGLAQAYYQGAAQTPSQEGQMVLGNMSAAINFIRNRVILTGKFSEADAAEFAEQYPDASYNTGLVAKILSEDPKTTRVSLPSSAPQPITPTGEEPTVRTAQDEFLQEKGISSETEITPRRRKALEKEYLEWLDKRGGAHKIVLSVQRGSGVITVANWRQAYPLLPPDLQMDLLKSVVNNRGRKSAADDIEAVFPLAESLMSDPESREQVFDGNRIFYDISQNRLASDKTRARAQELYDAAFERFATGEEPTDSLPADQPTSGDVGEGAADITSEPVPKGKVSLYQVRASQGKPVTDADGVPTGWKLNEYTDAIELVSEDATRFAVFPIADSKSYGDKLRALMKAEDWAIDNPVRTQSEAAMMEANYGGGRVEDVQPPKVRFTHTTKTEPGKGQRSGYYPGTYAYEKESGAIPPMEGKRFTGELLETEIYTLTNPDGLKKEASEAGFGYHSGNGNAEVKYLKSKGFKAIRRGSTGGVEIIVFDAADANFQPTVTTANETPIDAANVDGGSQGVQTEPAEGSTPAATTATVPPAATESTGEVQPAKEGEAKIIDSVKDADLVLRISRGRNYYTLWFARKDFYRGSNTYLTVLSTDLAEAREKAVGYLRQIASGEKLSIAFAGKKQAGLQGAKTVALDKGVLTGDELEDLGERDTTPIADKPIGFGKYAGVLLKDIIDTDFGYAAWLADNARENSVREYLNERPEILEMRQSAELEKERVKAFEEREAKRKEGKTVPVATLVRGDEGVIAAVEEPIPEQKKAPKLKSRKAAEQIVEILPPQSAADRVSPSLKPAMFQSQIDGANATIDSMVKNGVALNSDGAGVGKTRQIIAVADYFAKQGKPVVIISENAALGKPWEGRKIPVLGGSMAKDSQTMGVPLKLLTDTPKPGEIVVSTYNRIEAANVPPGVVVIFDESQWLANTYGNLADQGKEARKWQEKFRAIIPSASSVAYYTATPADKPHQLAYLHKVLGFGTPEEYLDEARRNGVVIIKSKYGGKEVSRYDVPFSQSRKKRLYQWLNNLIVQSGKEGRVIKREISYEGTDVQFHDTKGTDSGKNPWAEKFNDVVAELNQLQSEGWSLLNPTGAILYAAELAKIGDTVNIVKREIAAGRKAVVFFSRVNPFAINGRKYFTNMMGEREPGPTEELGSIPSPLEFLMDELRKEGISFTELHSKSKTTSQKAQKEFASDKDVLIASVESGGTGINLDDSTGKNPRTEVFMYYPYRGISTIQAMGRIWRASTVQDDNRPNRFVFITASDIGLDASRSAVLAKKLQLMNATLGGTAVSKLPLSKVSYNKEQLAGIEIADDMDESTVFQDRYGTLKPVKVNWVKTKAGDRYWSKASADLLEWWERGGPERTGLDVEVFKSKDSGDWIALAGENYPPESFVEKEAPAATESTGEVQPAKAKKTKRREKSAPKTNEFRAIPEYPDLETFFEREVHPSGVKGGWVLREQRTGAKLASGKTKGEAADSFRQSLLWQQAWNDEYPSVFEMVNKLIDEKSIPAEKYTQDYKVKPTKGEWVSILEGRLESLRQEREDEIKRQRRVGGIANTSFTDKFISDIEKRLGKLKAATESPPTAPKNPAENLVSFTAANGQKLVGEVQSVTGNKAMVAYQWNGKAKTQVVPVSQLGSPVASVATPPKYLYNQEQNTRKLGKHFPTALGVHADHDFRKSFASMAKDTSLGQDYQMIARMLSKMPEFKGVDLHLVADENIKYAGEYSWNNGKPSIAINLRLIARGQVDALGSILHEALHHVTLAKVRNPQGAFENEVVSKLDLIRESVREYAESRGFAEALEYELGSTEEFITALFTRPDFQALIASIPDSAAPGVAVGKFRSLLSEIFRLIAELIHGKPVLRGSALEQAMTTSLALFNTPFRGIETGGLEALNAARSYAGERAQMPQFMRDSLETAQAMAAAGKTSEEIRAVTGWFPGKYDGKMRWEIPDEEARFLPATKQWTKGKDQWAANLEEVLDHPALFEAYPEARKLRVSRLATSSAERGSFNAKENRIFLNALEGDVTNFSTLLHEVQHWIQEKEGFSKGAALERINPDVRRAWRDAQALKVAMGNDISDASLRQAVMQIEDALGRSVSASSMRFAQTMTSQQIENEVEAADFPERKYRRTAGEIEARDVQARQAFTPEQRKAVAPYSSENIAKEDAIVMFGGSGAQASVGKGLKALFPQTGDKAAKPINLSAAYQKAAVGKSSQWVPIKEVYEQAKADNPSLTPEAFMAQIEQQNEAGGVMISPVENVSTVEAARPFVVGNAGVEMLVPSGTAASRIDEETDAEYLAAVEAGDMEKAQAMVDAAKFSASPPSRDPISGKERIGDALSKQREDDQIIQVGNYAAFRFRDDGNGVFVGRSLGSLKRWAGLEALSRAAKQAIKEGKVLAVAPTFDSEDFYLSLGGKFKAVPKYPGRIGFVGDSLKELAAKSADPVTYDEQGNVIPLSQRFNPESPSVAYSRADEGEGVIDIGGAAEPADGGGTQLFKKRETALGSTFITAADTTLQERRPQEETLAKARKIIAEEVQKDEKGGRAVALQRFKSDLSIPPEVRAAGTGLIAQQADLLANLERDAIKQEGLDALADEAGKVSGIIGSDLEYWRNLQLAANLDIDKMAEEAGRTLNIFNVFRRLTPEGFLRRMKRQYNATVQESMAQNFDIPPGEVEAEIMRLWRMMREAGATARGEAIAAALKAFMPRRVNTRKIIESLFPQAGTRQRMSKGGEALVRNFFQMMAGPRDQKGPLAEFDESIQNALSGMLRKVMEAKGLVAKNQSVQATDIDKLVRSVSADELRFDKIAAADEAMQQELDAIEDPERRATLRQAWEEATAKMYTNIASDATVRRAINAELKGMNVDWRKMFDSNQKPDAIKAKVVDAVMTKIEGLLTNAADPTVRQNLNMLRDEVEAAFDFIASNKRTEWLAYREGVEARRRVAEHRAAFMEALRNQGVAEDALLRISKKLLAGPLPQKPDQNPVSALVGEHMKGEVPNFVDKLVALDVDRATAEQLDTAAKALRADIAEVEKLKSAERAVKKLMDSLKPKPRAPREKIEKALKALFTAAETGALDSQEFFDTLGEALGHPPLTPAQQEKIKKLTREINALPKGAARVDKQQELDEELALWKGIAARDVLLSAWYANILSGISTQGIGLFGNLVNFIPRSLFLAATNPRSANAYFQGAFGEGLKTGLKEAWAAMQGRGLYKVSKYGDKNMVSALELLRKKGPATLPEWVAYIASAGTNLRYVFRVMQAIDALAWNTAREGQAYLAAHRALLDQQRADGVKRTPEEFYRALIDNLGGDAKRIEEDMRAAREDLITRGQTPDLLTVDRMAREARNARRSSTATKLSNRFADRIVMQQDPEGIGDVISSIITVIQKKGNFMGVPFGQLLIPFNKIVANLFEQSLDYTPVGALRSYFGGHLTDIQSINWSGKAQFKDKAVQFDAVERAERMAASVTGTLAASVMFALASLFKDEPDEDVPFMLYGFGPESKSKRDQMPKGWTPYSAKIGDTYIKFSEMPFGVMFAAAGNALDAMRYKNMDKKSSAERLAYVLKTSAKGFTEQGVLSSFDTALEVLTFQASDKKFTDVPVNVAKGMVPAQGMLRDLSVLFDPVKIKDDTISAALLRDFPVVRRIGTRPALNVFGEPVTFDGRIPFVRRIATVREEHAAADYLGRNNLSVPGMAQTIVVGQYLPKDMRDRIQRRALETSAMENGVFTVEQDYNFRKRAGELTKVAVENLMKQVPTITSDKQRENVQNLINRKVEIARRRAMLEAVPAQ